MGSLLQPRFVALDSAHLAQLAGDRCSQRPDRRRLARAFLDDFTENGGVLLVCWHHFEELLRHRNEAVVAGRVQFFQQLPLVAWVASFSDSNVPGSIVDLLIHETAHAFEHPHWDAVAVRDEVAKSLFRYGPGKQIIQPFLNSWDEIRGEFWRQEQRAREVVAISRSGFAQVSATKVADWIGQKLRSPDEMAQRFGELLQHLAQDIRVRGDKRIANPDETAERFLATVKACGTELGGENPALQILSANGIDISDIRPGISLGEIGELAGFRHKLMIANRTLRLPWPALKAKVHAERLPSCVVQSTLQRLGQQSGEWKGSDLVDGYLSCLTPYAVATYVDKRTHENFRRARKKCPELAALVGSIGKASSYAKIPNS